MRQASRRFKGFTLIELMVVVAIIAILTAIALPSYTDYVIRGNLVDGTNQLASYRAKMEQFYQDARQYTTVTTPTTFTTPCAAIPPVGKWTFVCAVTATTYTITANGFGPVLSFAYTIDQNNLQTTTGVPSAAWGVVPQPVGTEHWIMKKGG